MKRIFGTSALVALALAATVSTASAQDKYFGVIAGVDFNSISGDDFDGTSSRTGFLGGFYAGLPVGRAVAIEPQVLYAQKGINDANSDVHLDNSYIEIPVLLRYNFNASGGPYLLAGPAVAFSVSCNLKDNSDSVSCDDLGIEPQTAISGVLGIGFQKARLGLEGRYDFDFGDSYKDAAGKNAAFEILLRYSFGGPPPPP